MPIHYYRLSFRQWRNSVSPIVSLVLFAAMAFGLFGSCGCADKAAASAITVASEIAAGYAIQHKTVTVADLKALAADLPGLAQGKALPSSDNVILANFIAALHGSKASVTGVSAIDAINTQIVALNNTPSPTAFQGIAWANLMDVAAGLANEVKLVEENPSLLSP